MNTIENLSPDTQAILLLCGHFGKKIDEKLKPLTPSEYAWLAQQLQAQNMRPADLLDTAATLTIKHFQPHKTISAERLIALLMRGGALALAIEAWFNNGIWIISRSDNTYPRRIKKRLGQLAPPIFYGIGELNLLQKGGLAIVGSRAVDKPIIEFTKLIAKKSAQHGIVVISGGARGVDTEAIMTALVHGGSAAGILSDSLARTAVASKYREALREGRLVLISPFDPNAGFTIGNAMARNKYIYTLSDWAVVVNSGYQEGGTWAGATENLTAQWVPLFVRQDQSIPPGNQQLLKQGGIALDKQYWQAMTTLSQQLSQLAEKASSLSSEVAPLSTDDSVTPTNNTEHIDEFVDLFEIIWPYLEQQLLTAQTEAALAQRLNLHPVQLRIWLKRAVEMGKIKKLTKPVRYINADSPSEIQPSLFD